MIYLAKLVSKSQLSGGLASGLLFCILLAMQGLITLSPFAVESHFGGGWKAPIHKAFILAIQGAMDEYFDFDVVSTWSNEIAIVVLQPVSLIWGIWIAATDYSNSLRAIPRCEYILDVHSYWQAYLFWAGGLAFSCADFRVSLLHLVVVGMFSLTLLLYPARKFFMNLWLRILESDKPVFTVVFGGLAALVKAGQEVAKLF